jgi:predicted transcriptional regulator
MKHRHNEGGLCPACAAARSDRDADVLGSLRSLGPSTVRELAEDTGRTRGQVDRALGALWEAGLVEVVRWETRSTKPAQVWNVTDNRSES